MRAQAPHGPGFVVLLALLAASASGCRGQRSEQPPIHLNQNMDQQSRYDPQEPSEFFPDGRSERPQVPGTVAYGELRDDPHYYEGTVDGQVATTLPSQIELTDALLQRGRDRFNIYCSPCHGQAGYSDGIVLQRGQIPSVPSLHDVRLRHAPIGHFFQVASNGLNRMPPYRYQIPVEDRWAIAAYVRALQLSQVVAAQ